MTLLAVLIALRWVSIVLAIAVSVMLWRIYFSDQDHSWLLRAIAVVATIVAFGSVPGGYLAAVLLFTGSLASAPAWVIELSNGTSTIIAGAPLYIGYTFLRRR